MITSMATQQPRGVSQRADRANIPCPVFINGSSQSRIAQVQAKTPPFLHETIRQSLDSNSPNLSAGLSTKLLEHIFGYLGTRDCFAASEVCHHWHTAALGVAQLWTEMSDFGQASPRFLVALDRASSVPVRLGLHLNGADKNQRDAILSGLSHHLHHIITLDITLHNADLALSALFDALARPAPILRELRISAAARPFPITYFLRQDLFSGIAPNLTRLSLCNIFLPRDPIAALSQVSFFHAASTEIVRRYPMAHIGNVLPSLSEYELDFPEGSLLLPGPSSSDNNHSDASPLANLRVLRLCSSFRPALQFPPYNLCPRISLFKPNWEYAEAAWYPATCASPTRFAVLSAFSGGRNDDDFYRLSLGVRGHMHTSQLLRLTTQHLRSLILDTGTWQQPDILVAGPDGLMQEFPQLTYLHLLISSRDRFAPLPLWLRTPALRVLRLSVVPPYSNSDSARAGHWQGREIDTFLASLQPVPEGRTVFLETEGFSPLAAPPPPPFVLRTVPLDVPLHHFLQDRVREFANWDDWLVNALDRMPEE